MIILDVKLWKTFFTMQYLIILFSLIIHILSDSQFLFWECSSINHLSPRVCECQSSELAGQRSGCISVNRWDIQDNGHASSDGAARRIAEGARVTPGKRDRERRRGYRQNEWRVFKGKIRDVFALLNGVEKKERGRNLLRWRQKCFLRCELARKKQKKVKQW